MHSENQLSMIPFIFIIYQIPQNTTSEKLQTRLNLFKCWKQLWVCDMYEINREAWKINYLLNMKLQMIRQYTSKRFISLIEIGIIIRKYYLLWNCIFSTCNQNRLWLLETIYFLLGRDLYQTSRYVHKVNIEYW